MKFFITIFLIFIVCCNKIGHPLKHSKPIVVATTNIIADVVHNIGGDFVLVYTLTKYGADPHQYKANEGDILRLAEANIIFHNGLDLEGKLAELLGRAQNSILSYSASADMFDEMFITDGNTYDPHIWFDPVLWVQAVQTVADGLSIIDPDNMRYYRKNEETYITELLKMNEEIVQALKAVPQNKRTLLTSHDAFSYFGRRYDFKTMGVQGISTSYEPSVNDLNKLAKTVMDEGITCIFTEVSVSSRMAEALISTVRSQGGQLSICGQLNSDNLAAGEDTYIKMYKENIKVIISGLTGNFYAE